MVKIICIHVCKWKMKPFETILRIGKRVAEEWWRG
jgi:hypothetical protein